MELKEVTTYVVDVIADNEKEAKTKAGKIWEEVCENGTYHYHETGDATTEVNQVYDVTNTDDPFNP